MENDFLPLPPRDGIFCDPEYTQLRKMSRQELMNMKKFKLFNRFGEMVFQKPVGQPGLDLTYVDLSVFEIE